ncbi:MAG TPA: hypothetical protein VFE72_12415 [Lysobacter sp.]|nr:hypothetical protein [Lysobacter sp.]
MDRIGLRIALVALSLAAPPACAQTVQKCVTLDGGVRYQSAPCDARERTAGVWSAVPDVTPALRVQAPPPPKRNRARASHRRARGVLRAAPRDACAEARRHRDDVERRVGLKRTYDLLSSLQARVFEACR